MFDLRFKQKLFNKYKKSGKLRDILRYLEELFIKFFIIYHYL